MGRLLLFGQRDTLLSSLLEALCPGRDIVVLDQDDPFSTIGTEAELLVVDLAAGTWQPEALIRTLRHRTPSCTIIALFPEGSRSAARGAVVAGAHATLSQPFSLEEFSALMARHLHAREPYIQTFPPDLAKSAAPPPASKPVKPLQSARGDAHIADLDALSVFVRGLSHEINNPLTTIRGFLQLFLHEDTGPRDKETIEAYQTMENESARIAEVIEELEYFSGTRRPTRTMLNAVELLGDSLKSMGLDHVGLRLDTSDPFLLADREQFTLAMRHLMGFLAANSPTTPPELHVSIFRNDHNLVVQACGRCPAADSAAPQHLLVPLYAGRSATRRPRHGLACVFGIARAHGGSLEVTREEGDRLRIRFSIPTGKTDENDPDARRP